MPCNNKKEPCINRKSLFCLFCTRENVLLGYRGHSWVPGADCVTGLRTRDWNPSRNKVTWLSGLSLPPFPLGFLVSPGTIRLATVTYWKHSHRGCSEDSSQSRGGTLGRPTLENLSFRDSTYCVVKSATTWCISVVQTARALFFQQYQPYC